MPDRLTREEVAHVASLARLELDDGELSLFTEQLASVLDHARDIEALDVTELPPTSHPLPITNVFREDEARPGLNREEFLAEAPAVEDHRFKVPKILGGEP